MNSLIQGESRQHWGQVGMGLEAGGQVGGFEAYLGGNSSRDGKDQESGLTQPLSFCPSHNPRPSSCFGGRRVGSL